MAVPVLFGLTGEPLCRADGTEIEADTAEEALAAATIAKRTPHLRVIAQDEHYLILLDVKSANRTLFLAETLEDVEAAMRAGANVHADDGSSTPLYLATSCGREQIVEWLLAHGADVNTRSHNYEMTPLHAATDRQNVRVVEMLLAAEANVRVHRRDGLTPLHLAVCRPIERIITLLLAHGADLNARAHAVVEWTPLHFAAITNNALAARLLLDAGADVNARDRYGETPLRSASEPLIAELLRAAGGEL